MGKDYYIFSNGRIKRMDNTIYFVDEEDTKKALPIEQVDQLHVFGEVDLNTKLLNYLSKYGVCIQFYNYYGFYSGTYYSKKKNISGLINVQQGIHYYFLDKRLFIAKQFIESAAHHITRNLRRHKEKTQMYIDEIQILREKISTANSVPQLMGIEGLIRKQYYRAFNVITKKYSFEKREKQPPTDPINTMISFGNSIMYTIVLGEIYKTQLDPTISFLHEPSSKRFSLSLDLAEVFKPLIIDSVIIAMINNNQIKTEDFDYETGICFLNEDGKKKFVKEIEKN